MRSGPLPNGSSRVADGGVPAIHAPVDFRIEGQAVARSPAPRSAQQDPLRPESGSITALQTPQLP